jgi:hypothetical protein
MKKIIILVIVMVGLSFISCDDNSNDPQPIVVEKIVMPIASTGSALFPSHTLWDTVFSPQNTALPFDGLLEGVFVVDRCYYFGVINSEDELLKIKPETLVYPWNFAVFTVIGAVVHIPYPTMHYCQTTLYQNDATRSYRYQIDIRLGSAGLAMNGIVYVHNIYLKLKEGYTIECVVNYSYAVKKVE